MSKLKHSLIKAGAGTGKTYELIQNISFLFKHFQKTHQREPRLIVCTFTKKATQELKERLLKTAEQELKASSDNSRSITKKGTKQASLKTLSLFGQYTQSPQLQISTIDGILSQFLKKYGHAIDLKPDFQISEDSINSQLFDSMAEDFIYQKHFSLLKKLPYPYLKDLFLSYYKFRIQYGPISFYDANDFAEFNFTRQALIETNAKGKEVPVKKSEFYEFLKNHPEFPWTDYESCKKLILAPEEAFSSKDFLPFFKAFQKSAEEFFPLFIQKKKNSPLLEIEDLLLFSLYLLNQNSKVAKSFYNEWDYWLIDEYQDTSLLQEQVIKKVTRFDKVFCVGDPAQSIYSFRHADPEVFKKREQVIIKKGEEFKILDTNRRSSPALIAFYNDFFLSYGSGPQANPPHSSFYNPYSRLKAPMDYSGKYNKNCVSFFSYNSQKKEERLQSLYEHIKDINHKGVQYKDIVILSSNNKDLAEMAKHLRQKNIPVLLYSSKKFSDQRILLDSLFLLKFLINPYDDTHLKALLRTPYFKFSDQELAHACYQHHNQDSYQAFWLFLNQEGGQQEILEKLNFYLNLTKQQGLGTAFQQALFDCGIMDLSYWQDPTFSATANLWKLIDMLKNKNLSSGQVFYKLMNEDQDSSNLREVPSGEDLSSIPMMTIHASKGLEFEHVILLDTSLDRSDLKRGDQNKNNIIYDDKKQKMAFACPIEGRNESKIKSFGHSVFNKSKDFQKSLERDRLFYVAMTRAKKSLSLFIPTGPKPEKNSWLERAIESFFNKQEDFYSTQTISLNSKPKILWDLKKGVFPKKGYSIQIFKALDFPSHSTSSTAPTKIKPQKAKEKPLKNYTFPEDLGIKAQSSKDFIQYSLKKQKEPAQNPFSYTKTKNLLAKIQLGKDLHFFMQKLFYFSDSELQTLLSHRDKKAQQELKTAIHYIQQLKKPSFAELFKQASVEWPFQLQRNNIVLHGQIDLWSKWDSQIYIVDYKSSKADKSSIQKTEKQLIFYSWILSQKYPKDKIIMMACYPLEQKTHKTEFQAQHKQECEHWFQSLKDLSL